ncbi:hypothetical protein [Novosphingobium sp. RL4]|uniref:hypothetical protein n=1 Tax=Novosphingobium sp. RL4 TaxID=3109595 RepID=UPI002D796CDB|nr:hypothetical protein [Novosphingobium sp. RL4]WRT94278.1 hypothetical protein U9J33_07210 [Novosphingobium sp. RL4]
MMTPAGMIALVATSISLISSCAAWTAILVTRKSANDARLVQIQTAARSSRATVVSANRQRWIDAIREDVASFIAARGQLAMLMNAENYLELGQEALRREEREGRGRVVMLRDRIDMRLNHTESDHLALIAALDNYDFDPSRENHEVLRRAGRKIFKAEWTRLKKEAGGIDPYVRETVPPRVMD